MVSLMLVVFILLSLLSLGSAIVYNKVRFSWLSKICTAIVISLPFEQIPALDIAGATLKISQILTILGFWVLALLFLKKDEQLKKHKFHPLGKWLMLFVLFSTPSWLFVDDVKRFAVTYVATILVFGVSFLLANFTQDLWKQLKNLLVVSILVGLFGIFQFVGDMLGWSNSITMLEETYRKDVFGVPRIHTTFLEPLYYAGSLFLPIISFYVLAAKREMILSVKWLKNKFPKIITVQNVNIFFVLYFILLLFLTISKSAFLAIGLVFLPLFIVCAKKFKDSAFYKKMGVISLIGVFFVSIMYFSIPKVESTVNTIYNNGKNTILGLGPSFRQREQFTESAKYLLSDNSLLGVGSGQYGPKSSFIQRSLTQNPEEFIVNNVYLEVWLEHGFFSFLVFLWIFVVALWQNFANLWKSRDWGTRDNLLRIILGFTLLAYLIQWSTFSPVYIMPIFIILGLLLSLNKNK